MGNTQNAFGRAEADEILFLNLPINNTTPDKSDNYVSYEVAFGRCSGTRPADTDIVGGRGFRHRPGHRASRSVGCAQRVDTIVGDQRAALTLSAGGFASFTRVNGKSFNRNAGLYAAVVTPFAGQWEASQSVSFSRSSYAAYPGIANNAGRSERSAVAKFSLSRQFSKALVDPLYPPAGQRPAAG